MEDSAALALAQSLSVLIGEFSPSPGSQTHHNSRMNTFLRLFGRYTRQQAWKRVQTPRRYTIAHALAPHDIHRHTTPCTPNPHRGQSSAVSDVAYVRSLLEVQFYSCWRCLRSHRVGHASSSATTVSSTIFRALTDAAVLSLFIPSDLGALLTILSRFHGPVDVLFDALVISKTSDARGKYDRSMSQRRRRASMSLGRTARSLATATRNPFNTTRGFSRARSSCLDITPTVFDDRLNVSPLNVVEDGGVEGFVYITTPFDDASSAPSSSPSTSTPPPHSHSCPSLRAVSGAGQRPPTLGISTGAVDALARYRRYILVFDTGEGPSPTPAKRLQPQRRALIINSGLVDSRSEESAPPQDRIVGSPVNGQWRRRRAMEKGEREGVLAVLVRRGLPGSGSRVRYALTRKLDSRRRWDRGRRRV
ncbi:uncharacterized protein SCHCODRAFT_0258501 [Schizophyllum commune H4-8]|uniref:Uncharacterized protein n=1 Tax=Schizophyllum commune (strain H4-8 / FGSC 9210) TaxID=578458 RepID=D8QGW2_SCHCM|nr:uncharacterized protein SCHCODRAFT_0258501 [Schizophyllum commune H4-8]KAI5886916.1 hypothetical protein SCHCODRAFT_0258501 [Schizophyllum commune H4-8]